MGNIAVSARQRAEGTAVKMALRLTAHLSTVAMSAERAAEKDRLVIAALRNPGAGIYGAKNALIGPALSRVNRLERRQRRAAMRKEAVESWLRGRGVSGASQDQHQKPVPMPARLYVVK